MDRRASEDLEDFEAALEASGYASGQRSPETDSGQPDGGHPLALLAEVALDTRDERPLDLSSEAAEETGMTETADADDVNVEDGEIISPGVEGEAELQQDEVQPVSNDPGAEVESSPDGFSLVIEENSRDDVDVEPESQVEFQPEVASGVAPEAQRTTPLEPPTEVSPEVQHESLPEVPPEEPPGSLPENQPTVEVDIQAESPLMETVDESEATIEAEDGLEGSEAVEVPSHQDQPEESDRSERTTVNLENEDLEEELEAAEEAVIESELNSAPVPAAATEQELELESEVIADEQLNNDQLVVQDEVIEPREELGQPEMVPEESYPPVEELITDDEVEMDSGLISEEPVECKPCGAVGSELELVAAPGEASTGAPDQLLFDDENEDELEVVERRDQVGVDGQDLQGTQDEEVLEVEEQAQAVEDGGHQQGVEDNQEGPIVDETVDDGREDVRAASLAAENNRSENSSNVFETEIEMSETGTNEVPSNKMSENKLIERDALVDALEHLTEESAKEIFLDSETISDSTSKVISTFVDKISNKKSETEAALAEALLAADSDISSTERMLLSDKSPESEVVDPHKTGEAVFREESDGRSCDNLGSWNAFVGAGDSVKSDSEVRTNSGPGLGSSHSLAVQPSSQIRIDVDVDDVDADADADADADVDADGNDVDVDEEERHTMEDVIDEFVEEINEEEMFEEQVVEQQLTPNLKESEILSEKSSKRKRKRKTEEVEIGQKRKRKKKQNEKTAAAEFDQLLAKEKDNGERFLDEKIPHKTGNPQPQPETREEVQPQPEVKKKTRKRRKRNPKLGTKKPRLEPETVARPAQDSDPAKAEKVQRKKRRSKTRNRLKKLGLKLASQTGLVDNRAVAHPAKNPDEEDIEDVTKIAEFMRSQMMLNEPNGIEAQKAPSGDIVRQNSASVTNPEPDAAETPAVPLDAQPQTQPPGLPEQVENSSVKKGRKRGRKPKRAKPSPTERPQAEAEPQPGPDVPVQQPAAGTFKPVSDWKKVLKFPQNYSDLSTKALEQQVFRNPLPPYAPCVPRNTSQNLINNLSDRDLEQLNCPGCKDRFLIPTTFIQHLYRKSVRINFDCKVCGSLSFYNRCHLRTHVLSHLEVDGSSSVTVQDPESLTVHPLERSEFDFGFVDDSFSDELDAVHREVAGSTPGHVQCSECRLTFDKNSISSHFADSDKSRSNFFECPDCKMSLPNRCSLSAHRRIHRKNPPFVCPECGETFETWPFFRNHVLSSCQHEARVLTVSCKICRNKLAANDKDNEGRPRIGDCDSYVTAEAFFGHIYESHVKLFYKCSFCPKAFVEKVDVYSHNRSAHQEDSTSNSRQKIADFSLLYKAPFLKAPNNLFSTREGFEKRLSDISTKWPKKFMFRCVACSNFFETAETLSAHNFRWCRMHHQSTESHHLGVSKLFTETDNSTGSSDRNMSERDRREEMIQHLAHLEGLSANCNDCTKISIDFRAHLTKHPNTTAALVQQQLQQQQQQQKQVPNASNDSVVNTSVTLTDATPMRVTRQRLETIGRQAAASQSSDSRPSSVVEVRTAPDDLPARDSPKAGKVAERRPSRVDSPVVKGSTTEPTETPAPRKRGRPPASQTSSSQSLASQASASQPALSQPGPSHSVTPPPSQPASLQQQPKSVKLNVVDAKPFVEALGIDVPNNRRLLAFNKLDRQALAFGSTVRHTARNKKSRDPKYSCALCSFASESRDEFQRHIPVHRPVVVRGVVGLKTSQPSEEAEETGQASDDEVPAECFQCKECGMCFASEPSWSKHLFLLHRIKNPGPEDYCQDLKTSSIDATSVFTFNDDDDDDDDADNDRLVIDEGRHPCNVCRQTFSNPLELKRHFRTHGMAFLKLQHSPPHRRSSLKAKQSTSHEAQKD